MVDDVFYPSAAGLRPPAPPRPGATSAVAGMGVRSLRSNPADAAIMQQDPFERMAPIIEPRPRLERPQAQAGGVYFNPTTDRFSVGGQEFGRRDYDIAMQTAPLAAQPSPAPMGEGWQRISPTEYQAYLQSIGEGRGFLGNVGMGFRDVGEGVIGGIGRGLEMLGAEGVGGALVSAGEFLGPTAADDARDAAIAQNQSLLGRIGTAATRSIPTLGLAVAGGLGGGALAAGGLRAAAAGGAVARAGQFSGVAATVFPMEVQSSFTAAQQGGYDVTDPEVQADIWSTAIVKTLGQTVPEALLAGGLSRAFGDALRDASRRTILNTVGPIVGVGSAEAAAETFATLADRVMFDPDLRAEFNENDWAALAPLIIERYGEEALVAAGAGFLLGGGARAAITPFERRGGTPGTDTPPTPRRPVDQPGEVNLLTGQTETPTRVAPPPQTPEQIAAGQSQLDAMGVPTVAPGAAPSLETGAVPTAPPILAGSDTGPLGARVAALNPEEQDLANRWAARAQPPLPLTPDMAVPEVRVEGPVEQATPIALARTDLPPGAERLRQRPSERVETYAPAPPPTAETALGAQLNRLMQQQRALQEARAAQQAALEAAPVVEPQARDTGEITARDYDAALAEWELVRREQENPDTQPGLARLNKKAQREWVDAVRAGTADADLFGKLAKRRVGKAAPLVATPATRTEPGPSQAEMDAMRRQVEAARAAQAEAQRMQGQAATLRSLGQRLEQRRPVIPPLPANTYGTEDGLPFRRKAQATNIANRRRVAEQITEETDQVVTPKDLEAVEVPGGWALRVKSTPPPKTPPTPPKGRGDQNLRNRAPKQPKAPKDLKQPKAPKEPKQPKAEKEPEPEPEAPPAPAPTIRRGDAAPSDMGAIEAWDSYVAEFLPITFGAKNLGQLQARWAAEVKAGRGTYDTARLILEDSPTYAVLEAREVYTTSADPEAQADAVSVLLEQAFAGDPTGSKSALLGNKSVMKFAQETLTELNWNAAARQALVDFAALDSTVEARNTDKPTAQIKALNALLESTGVILTAENVAADTVSNPASELVEEIIEFNKDPHTPAGWEQRRLRELVRNFTAYARENPAAYDSVVEGNTPLYQYLKGGDVNVRAGTITPDANAVDPRTQSRVSAAPEVVERGGAGIAQMTTRGGGRYSRVDYNDITTALDADGKPLAGAMPVGKQRMAIKTFLKRMQNAPRVYDFKDQADLRRKDPALYRRAAAARPEGDFDTANAAGYSFGDGEVIIFTDRIANEKHLRFVLAHETLGHYGLRGILPARDFDALMEGLYDSTPSMQMSVDAAMAANPDLSKSEAVEEYLSDFAADLDTSIIRRVWNAIKGALNKLGVTFADDSVRYVLDQARRYARSPLQGFPTDLNAIGARAYAVETGAASPGRFASADSFFKDQRAQDEFARMGLPVPRSFQEGLDAMGGKWRNFDDAWRGFKSTFLSLHGFDARTNPGLKRLHDVLQEATTIAMSVRNTLNETMRPALNRAILGVGGMVDAEYARTNELLHHARIRAIMRLRETPLDSRDPLVVFDEASGTYVRTDEVQRLDDMNRITFEEARNGFTYTFTNTDAEGNVVSTETVRVPGDPDLTEGGKVWLAYNAARKSYIDTELRLLIAQLSAGKTRESTALKEIGSVVPDGQLTTSERALMRIAFRRYQELYNEGSSVNADGAVVYVDTSMATAKEFAKAFNMAIIANEDAATDTEAQARNNALRQFFDQGVADDVIAQVEAFKKRANFTDDRFIVQNKIIGLQTQAMQENGAADFARNSIASQYSPIVRTGDYETRLVAKNAKTGKVVSLDAGYKDGLLYAQFDARDKALAFAKTVRGAFGTNTYTVKARGEDGQMVDMDVVFEPVVDKVLVEAANPLGVNLNEFIAGLNYFDINLPPAKREEVVMAMTAQDAAARRRLRAGLNPGDARDAISGIAQHIDGRASTIAKVQTRPLIDELMNLRIRASNELWSGSAAEVEQLRARMERTMADPDASKEARTVAKREYEEALMMYNNTSPGDGDSRKNEALNKAARTLSFLDQNASVNESDFEGSATISAWRSYTSLIQLGGSIATGLLNPISVYTNGVPYLASYNSKTAFGGGFGAGRSLIEVQRAFKQVGVPGLKNLEGMNTAMFWDGVAASRDLQAKHGVTAREAQMIAREIREGRMIPAQSNALVNSSRGRTTRGALSKGIDLWMSPFNLTEQASRRAFGLAAFRLEYARQMQAIDPTLDPSSGEFTTAEQTAYDRAVDFAGRAMDTALGDYSVLNRPAFFRAGLPSMLYMYKVFPTTSIQMFNNLSMNGKMGMLAGLWLLGGVAAFPFAEDLEDLLDTLMQKAGVGEGSVRAWAAQRLDEISPGLSPLILRGVMGNVLPGDIAGRVALSVVPGTDILLAGANTTRALEEIAGPMPSALLGTMQFASDLVRAPFSETVTMERVFREAPVTGLRMAADAYAYTQSGAIIDRRGYVVAPDVTTGELIMRLAGFYPRRAAETYGNVRIINRIANYRREAATAYRQEWVSARIRNDRDRMREIEQAVQDWNEYHRGGPLVIDNFRQSATRAYREAIRPATERGLRAVPQASRDQLVGIADALTF